MNSHLKPLVVRQKVLVVKIDKLLKRTSDGKSSRLSRTKLPHDCLRLIKVVDVSTKINVPQMIWTNREKLQNYFIVNGIHIYIRERGTYYLVYEASYDG